MAVRLLPDAERFTSAYLRAHPDVAVLVADRVYTAVPSNPTFPLAVVTRIGGAPRVRQHLDHARVQVDCWGGRKFEAHQLARTVQAALETIDERADLWRPLDLGVATGAEVVNGPVWLPDPADGRARYLVDAVLFLHP